MYSYVLKNSNIKFQLKDHNILVWDCKLKITQYVNIEFSLKYKLDYNLNNFFVCKILY